MPEQIPDELLFPDGYRTYYQPAWKKGYSGVALWTKKTPLNIYRDFMGEEFDREGRVILAEYPQFLLYNVYFPNGRRGLERLDYKLRFYARLLDDILERKREKPVIVAGDFNTAHTEIDLARPRENENVSGFMPEERVWIDRYLDAGLCDIFRLQHPDMKGYYTWWTFRAGARERNVGWRIDYFLISEELLPHVDSARIHAGVLGSDHCPISLTLNLP